MITFNQAKAVLRQHGYNVFSVGNLGGKGCTEYCITRMAKEGDQYKFKEWQFTAQTIKDGVYRAMSLAGKI